MKIISICIFLISLSGCISEKKCWEKYPPQIKDSVSYVEKVRDSLIPQSADSSMSSYLIECAKTADGYKARIIQLLTQRPGTTMNIPVSSISGNVLTTTAGLPGRDIHVQIKTVYLNAVKSLVYVKITNVLTWWQKWLMWIGGVSSVIVVGLVGFKWLKFYGKI